MVPTTQRYSAEEKGHFKLAPDGFVVAHAWLQERASPPFGAVACPNPHELLRKDLPIRALELHRLVPGPAGSAALLDLASTAVLEAIAVDTRALGVLEVSVHFGPPRALTVIPSLWKKISNRGQIIFVLPKQF